MHESEWERTCMHMCEYSECWPVGMYVYDCVGCDWENMRACEHMNEHVRMCVCVRLM